MLSVAAQLPALLLVSPAQGRCYDDHTASTAARHRHQPPPAERVRSWSNSYHYKEFRSNINESKSPVTWNLGITNSVQRIRGFELLRWGSGGWGRVAVASVSCLIKTFCQSKPIYDISCLGANSANSRLLVRQGSTTGDCALLHRSTTPCPILWVTNCGAGLWTVFVFLLPQTVPLAIFFKQGTMEPMH